MKAIFFAIFLIAILPTLAAETVVLKTPRGADVNVALHIPQGSNLPAVVVAPGQSCNSKGLLFETLGQDGLANGVAIVRFEWNYCNTNPTQPMPSANLVNEIEDFQTVLNYAKSHPSINKDRIALSGKSLGSIVAYAVFAKEVTSKSLILLTPVCSYTTDENGKPLRELLKVCEKNYPKIKDDSRSVLMAMGNFDSLCLLPVLYDFLKDSKGNISTYVAGGDHGFRIKDSAGTVDQIKTQGNLNSVVNAVLNWRAIND